MSMVDCWGFEIGGVIPVLVAIALFFWPVAVSKDLIGKTSSGML